MTDASAYFDRMERLNLYKAPCPACGCGHSLAVTGVDYAAGVVTLAASDVAKFYPGQAVTFGVRRRWWRRYLDGVRAFWMAVRR